MKCQYTNDGIKVLINHTCVALKFEPVDWPGTENWGLNVAKFPVLPAKCANDVPLNPAGNCGIWGT